MRNTAFLSSLSLSLSLSLTPSLSLSPYRRIIRSLNPPLDLFESSREAVAG